MTLSSMGGTKGGRYVFMPFCEPLAREGLSCKYFIFSLRPLPHSAVNYYERKGNLTLRIFTENNTIKIRREGIFLCLDGSKADSPSVANVLGTLSNFIKIQCKNFDIPFKMGLLSWDRELEATPSADFLSSNTISKS